MFHRRGVNYAASGTSTGGVNQCPNRKLRRESLTGLFGRIEAGPRRREGAGRLERFRPVRRALGLRGQPHVHERRSEKIVASPRFEPTP